MPRGDPRAALSIAQRLAANGQRDKVTGCLLWTGGQTSAGYGRMSVENKRQLVHRLAWREKHGPIPPRMEVCHDCSPASDNPLCFEDAHLFLGTHKQNMQDRDRKGRIPMGDNHPSSVLTSAQVLAIRTDKRSSPKVAADYEISARHVRQIRSGARWGHI